MVEYMYENLESFGDILATDGKVRSSFELQSVHEMKKHVHFCVKIATAKLMRL